MNKSNVRPIQDLREWLARVEQMGELVRVDRPVNRDEEMSAISYLLAKQQPSPAVLFSNVTRALSARAACGTFSAPACGASR
jgi:UbiD family decarboxylase